MADTLVIYYSLEGNVEFLAKKLAESINADLFKIETVKEYPKSGLLKFFHGGKDVLGGYKPELKKSIPNLSAYDKIVIGSPVWAAKPAAPLNTLFEKADFTGKKCYAFASSGGGSVEKCLKIMAQGIEKNGGKLESTASFINPLKNEESALENLSNFVKTIL